MRILVCVKFVPDPTDDVEFTDAMTLARSEGTGLLSELDEYAVEQALVLAEQFPGATVTALTMGPQAAEVALRKALQMGADDAILVSDPAIAGSDVFGTATVLAAAVGLVGPDLVVCGMSSTDGAGGVLPALLSSRLGWPLLSLAATVVPAGPGLRITRVDEVGLRTAEAALPAVLSVTDQSGEPRYPSFKDVLSAKRKTIGVLSLADLGVTPTEVGATAARVKVTAVSHNPERAAGRVLVDDSGSSVPELVEFLTAATR